MSYLAYQYDDFPDKENDMDMHQENIEHTPVMPSEAIRGLNINPTGRYLDATFGRGGHSRLILNNLGQDGELIVLDRDPEAIAEANMLASEDARVTVHQGVFSDLVDLIADEKGVDGALFDLGVSSPQIDQAERGFSFQQEGPLDMRMNNAKGLSAASWLARADRQEIVWVLETYGEEAHAGEVADKIIERRKTAPIVSTKDLVGTILSALPRFQKSKHPATKVFQAIRMHINAELDEIRDGLGQIVEKLAVGGRLVVISYHSLEHKLVSDVLKQSQRSGEWTDSTSKPPKLRKIGHAQRAGSAELVANRRARSALLRTWELKI